MHILSHREVDVTAVAANDRAVQAWAKVERALLTHCHKPDLDGARALYAAVAAHRLPGQPVWAMLVAPPGSVKTELLSALDGLPNFHSIDQVTPNTFISGQIQDPKRGNKQPSGLLNRVGDSAIIAIPDFSTVSSMKADDRGGILADMRRIFDGQLHKEFGTSDNLDQRLWRGRITFVVAATPQVDRQYGIFQSLGERFIMIRWPRAGGIEAAIRAMEQDRDAFRKELREAVHELLEPVLRGNAIANPGLSHQLRRGIAAIAELTVRARTYQPKDGPSGKDILFPTDPESPTRLSQQLRQLAGGNALLEGRSEITEEDFRLVRRVAFDCIPAPRREVLEALIQKRPVNLPHPSSFVARGDLVCLGLLNEGDYNLSELALTLLSEAGIQVEGLYDFSPPTEREKK